MNKVLKVKFLLPIAVLFCVGIINSCQEYAPVPRVIKTELWKGISAAISLLTTTQEGAAGSNYALGSKAPFIVAITSAQIVYADVKATQSAVTTAMSDLDAAVGIYKSKKVPAVDPANLVGHYTFDYIGTTSLGAVVQDYSGNGRMAFLNAGHSLWGSGVPTLALDRFGADGTALHFEKGANVEIPYGADFNPPNISISLWAKSDINSPIVGNQYLVSMNRRRGYELKIPDTQKASFTVNPAENPGGYITEESNSLLTQGLWRHIVVTFGGGRMKFYVNGSLLKDVARSGTVLKQVPSVSLILGQDLPTNLYSSDPSNPNYVNSGGYFIGIMDEVRIYKSVLTQDQITSIYNIEKP